MNIDKKAGNSHNHTTIASYGFAIQQAMEARGYDTADLFRAVGIDRMPSSDPMDRLTTAQVAALFDECARLTGDRAFGLAVAPFIHPSNLHALGYSLLASSTLRDCCERFVNYLRLVSEQGRMQLSEDDERFCITTVLLVEGVSYHTMDAWTAFQMRLFRLLYRPDLNPLAVSLAHPCPPGCEPQYQKSFNAPVTFDAQHCEICLDRESVDKPLMGGNREIAFKNDRIIEEYLADMDKADIVNRVKQIIVQTLPSGNCNKKQVAAELAMSPSALQQKLGQRDTSFLDILSDVREALAMSYIEQPRYSITEIGFLLGFADSSSFTRAFRKWAGKSPRDYRRARGMKE